MPLSVLGRLVLAVESAGAPVPGAVDVPTRAVATVEAPAGAWVGLPAAFAVAVAIIFWTAVVATVAAVAGSLTLALLMAPIILYLQTHQTVLEVGTTTLILLMFLRNLPEHKQD